MASDQAKELNEFTDDAPFSEHLSHGEHEVSCRRTFGKFTGQLEPDHLRDEHMIGWPSMTASASMPPSPQPRTPIPLIIGVWESVPTRESG